jgi:hypothetical protein
MGLECPLLGLERKSDFEAGRLRIEWTFFSCVGVESLPQEGIDGWSAREYSVLLQPRPAGPLGAASSN